MAELREERSGDEPSTEDHLAGFQLVAQQAIDTSLELMDKLETA